MAAKRAALKTSAKVMARLMLTVPAIELVHELGTVPTFEVVEMSKRPCGESANTLNLPP
jgi:hypothetical protein